MIGFPRWRPAARTRSVVLIGLVIAAYSGASWAQDELADLVPSARGDERLERFLADLAERDWVDDAPEVAEARRRYADSADLVAAVEMAVAMRETEALQGLVRSRAVPETQKVALLVGLLDHDAPYIAAMAGASLVQRDAFEQAYVLAEAIVGWNPERSSQVLGTLHPDRANSEWLPVARQVIRNAWLRSQDGEPFRTQAAWTASWVLVHSADPADHALVREAVFRFPASPLLWIAVSRVEAGPELRGLAESLLDDASVAPGLRAAAGLTLLETDPAVGEEVFELVLRYLLDFGCGAACAERIVERDPAWLRWMEEGKVLLSVLDELPTELLRSHLDELLPLRYDMVGALLFEVLGERMPDVLFHRLQASSDLIPPDIHPALFDVAAGDPALLARLRTLIGESAMERLLEEAERPGFERLGHHPRLERGLGGLNRIGSYRLWSPRR